MSPSVRLAFPLQARHPKPQEVPQAAIQPASPPHPHMPTRLARMLALAHHVEHLIEAGALADYAEAARALGLTRARMTQVMNLLLLAPSIQEGILLGAIGTRERTLRPLVSEPCWASPT